MLWGFQLWVNLPAKDKMTAPRYQDIPGDQIPEAEVSPGVHARIIAGTLGGFAGVITKVATEPVYYDLHFAADAVMSVPLPEGHNAFVYVYQGRMQAGPETGRTTIERGEIALLSHGDTLELVAAGEASRMILIAGRPLNEPIARYGPFVMNTADEIRQAFIDYQAGRL